MVRPASGPDARVPKRVTSSERFAREVARLLRERRERLGLSKLGLAQRAGIDQRTVTFIEDGINVPSIGTLHALCGALGITVTTIVAKADRKVRGLD